MKVSDKFLHLVVFSKSGKLIKCDYSKYLGLDFCSNCLFFAKKEVSKNVKEKK